jgi:hypothetical protein
MFYYFTNICAEILLHILGCGFCTEHHILAQFSQMLLPIKALKIKCVKGALLCHKNVIEIDQRFQTYKHFERNLDIVTELTPIFA